MNEKGSIIMFGTQKETQTQAFERIMKEMGIEFEDCISLE